MSRKRPMNRSRLLLYAAALVAAACQDRQSPTAAPSFLIQDATHNSGNPHFYWLPPMTRQPSFTGTFDGTLAPVVEISELGGVTGCTSHVVATFTTTTGPGSETVRVDLVNQLYIVNWRTKAFNRNTACTYRIRFLVAGLELGIADVDVVDNGAQLKRVDTDQFVPLLDDGTLPIKARVEFGAVTFALTGNATACRPGRDCGEAVVTPVAGQDVTVLTTAQTAGLFLPSAALREQIVVLIESRTDRPCIPRDLMALPQFDDCYRYIVNPTAPIERLSVRQATEGEINTSYSFGDGRDETLADNVIVGMCVEVGNLTPAQAARLDIFRFEPPAGPVTTIRDASAGFLPCDPNFGTTPPVGAAGVLRQGWRLVMHGLHALVGARTAYASTSLIHLGLGGSTCCTSYFTWGVPGVLFPNLPDTTFVVPVGSTVVPSVVVKDSGGTPIAGAMVTFAAASGTIIGTNPVTTGADGIAHVSWQLPSTPGLSTLTASTPGAAESPRHFLATGTAPIQVDAGGFHSCALKASGQMFCWGSNSFGQLGDGTTTQRLVPTAVAGGVTFATLSAGGAAFPEHTCGVTTSGAAYCWGDNSAGQLGDGTNIGQLVPTPVAGGLSFAAISAGANHTCGVTTSNVAYCWGSGGLVPELVPTPVAGGLSFAAVSAGFLYTCGVTTSGAAYCWGLNDSGQLGDGTTTQRLVPTPVTGGLSFAAVSAGFGHTCGVTTSGAAYCWGSNGGRVGGGTTTQKLLPPPGTRGLTIATLTPGLNHTFGVGTRGAACCLG